MKNTCDFVVVVLLLELYLLFLPTLSFAPGFLFTQTKCMNDKDLHYFSYLAAISPQ